MSSQAEQQPKVFLSYSWSSPEHQRWVREFAERLEGHGVAVVLDQWDLRPGQDKYVYMERMVLDPEITKVLVVSDRSYAEKADRRTAGVGVESVIISREVYEKADQEKFVALVTQRDTHGEPYLPVFLRNQIYFDFSAPERYHDELEALVRNLFGRPEHVRPARGTPPPYVREGEARPSPTRPKLEAYRSAVLKDSPTASGWLDDYLVALESVLYDMRLDAAGHEPDFREKVIESIREFLPNRNEFVDLLGFVARYGKGDEPYERLHTFFERLIVFDHARVSGKTEVWTDNIRFVIWEMFLYAVALLVRRERFVEVTILVSRPYFYSNERFGGTGLLKSAGAFNPGLRSMEDQGYRSGDRSAALLRERATHPEVPFGDLVQADFLLFLQTTLNVQDQLSRTWYPRLLGYAEDTATFGVFARATSREFFDRFKVVLGVRGREELLSAVSQVKFPEVPDFWGERDRYERLINLERIGSV